MPVSGRLSGARLPRANITIYHHFFNPSKALPEHPDR
jgi:hypothetical protein